MNAITERLGGWRSWLAPHRLALIGIVLLSIFFNFWQLGQNGFGNLYYAAAVKSMGSNWHAFFFNSLDSAGFVTIDKPPLGFWFQVLSTKLFGFTPFAIFFPQALAGVLSVVLLYHLVNRHFGHVAGLISAMALAASPISVVTNRNNTIDSTLMLVLLLATWAIFLATETDKLRWLIVAGVLIGLGFNIKMLEAYLVVPAFALTYILGSNRAWARRLANLVGAGFVMAGISVSWALAVDLTPAALRPWVGSTQDNSVLSLAFGYNGLQRLTGNSGGGGAGGRGGAGGGFPGGGDGGFAPGDFSGAGGRPNGGERPSFGGGGQGGPGGNGGGAGGGGGQVGMFNTGNPGIFRLFTQPLGGQIVWLLPIALIGLLALAVHRKFNPREDRQQQSMILWGGWLVTMAIFFSVATFFHQYYLSQMAPAIAALAGIGIVIMWEQYLQPGWKGWLLPVSLVVTALVQIGIITSDNTWGTWLIPVIAIPTAIAGIVLVLLRTQPDIAIRRNASVAAVALGLFAVMLTPVVWSAYPALNNITQDLPLAGLSTGGVASGGGTSVNVNSQLVSYLEANKGSATYLVAVQSSGQSDALIIATGEPIMTLGGFSGSDPILTSAEFAALVKAGTIRFYLAGGTGGMGGSSSSTVSSWVTSNCSTVSYGSTTSSGTLYDCSVPATAAASS